MQLNAYGSGLFVGLSRGGLSSTVTYFAEEGVIFQTSACPRFVKEGYFCVPRYEVWGVENPLTI